MSLFFNKFPKTAYNISGNLYPSYDVVTDITFRIGVIQDVMSELSAYYTYTIKDGETPEILAERVYGNPEAHWIILYANEMYDAQYDWPLNIDAFTKYIISKYGSIAAAKTGIHHYEKIIARELNEQGFGFLERHYVDYDSPSPLPDGIPYETYLTLPEQPTYFAYDIGGKTMVESVSRRAVSFYDFEKESNEKKRNIRIIKKEYYAQIMQEFQTLTRSQSAFIRKVV